MQIERKFVIVIVQKKIEKLYAIYVHVCTQQTVKKYYVMLSQLL